MKDAWARIAWVGMWLGLSAAADESATGANGGGRLPRGDLGSPRVVAEWTFDGGLEGWTPNAHIADVATHDGILRCRTIDSDPMFIRRGLELPAAPWQWVVIRMKSNRTGNGELFWTAQTTGRYGGFGPDKATSFMVPASESFRDIVIAPFWQGEGTIRQLRLDLFDGATFEIASIQVLDWSGGAAPLTNVFEWALGEDAAGWRRHPASSDMFSPPLDLDVRERGWATVEIEATSSCAAALVWSSVGGQGARSVEFAVRPGRRAYNFALHGAPGWTRLGALGLRWPAEEAVRPLALRLDTAPSGPPELEIEYFGPEDALPRAGRPFRLLAHVRNLGGQRSPETTARLNVPGNWVVTGGAAEATQRVPAIEHNEEAELQWTVVAADAGKYDCELAIPGWVTSRVRIAVTSIPAVPPAADGVPAPRPVPTDVEICAFYFPGWESDAKWDCIRRLAPIRKPLLGYYDEGNPECIDWQIKWAAENGISTFLVDWYWQAGARCHEHWFEAYRRARHRDRLKVAIMWANHNAPGTHSADDWRAVTRHWIERYFPLPAYQRLNGKPAMYLWDPQKLRQDVGGTNAVRELLAESEAMARAAGYPGITFVAMNRTFTPSETARLAAEGYAAVTSYHEFGTWPRAVKRWRYEQVVEYSPAAWAHHSAVVSPLMYLPVVETGWDARPWQGGKARVLEGRTPELFCRLLQSARTFAASNGSPAIVLGPVNEWGEGSYIEPNLEFGFDMYEAVRQVFGRGDPSTWPVNFGPRDVGLGPYDYPAQPPTTAWTFDAPAREWRALMGIADLEISGGALRFRTTTRDPALLVQIGGVRARDFRRLRFVIRITDEREPLARGRVFWSTDAAAMTEFTRRLFTVPADGESHEVAIDLADNPHWRGRITVLRLDPCTSAGARVAIEEFALLP